MEDEQSNDLAFVEYVVKMIVDAPSEVKVRREVSDMGVCITVCVSKSDMGFLIGRQGTTANAIRTLTRIIGRKNGMRLSLDILEPDGTRQVKKPVNYEVEKTKSIDEVINSVPA